MNTKDIFIAKLLVSTDIKFVGDWYDYYHGSGIEHRVYHQKIKYILVKKEEKIYDERHIKVIDLNTKKIYSTELPFDKGKLYIGKNLIAFDRIYPSEKQKLSKRKILKLGNYAIKQMEQLEKEKNKK